MTRQHLIIMRPSASRIFPSVPRSRVPFSCLANLNTRTPLRQIRPRTATAIHTQNLDANTIEVSYSQAGLWPSSNAGQVVQQDGNGPSNPQTRQTPNNTRIVSAASGVIPVAKKKPKVACPCGQMFTTRKGLESHREAREEQKRPCPPLPEETTISEAVASVTAAASDPAATKAPSKALRQHLRFLKRLVHPRAMMLDKINVLRDSQLCDETVSWRSPGELVCTYNWANREEPTIMVPGGAPVWRSPTQDDLPVKLRPDRGLHFKDNDSARLPAMQWAPVFAALEAQRKANLKKPTLGYPLPGHAQYPLPSDPPRVSSAPPAESPVPLAESAESSHPQASTTTTHVDCKPNNKPLKPLDTCWFVDLLVNRGTLSKLLDLCLNVKQAPFILRCHLEGRATLILERCDPFSVTKSKGLDGYGPAFERHFASWPEGLEDSASHHRVVRYRLGSLDCMVRCEVDVACGETGTEPTRVADGQEEGDEEVVIEDADVDETDDIDELEAEFGELAVDPEAASPLQSNSSAAAPPGLVQPKKARLALQHVGDFNEPPLAPAELKATISARYVSNARHHLHQLWFGRTPTIVMGHHDGHGNFSSVAIRDMSAALDRWENTPSYQAALARLVGLVALIRRRMRATSPTKPCILVWNGRPDGADPAAGAELELWPCRGWENGKSIRHALPFDVSQTWFPNKAPPGAGPTPPSKKTRMKSKPKIKKQHRQRKKHTRGKR